MRWAWSLAGGAVLLAAAGAAAQDAVRDGAIERQRSRLVAARGEAIQARARAGRLEREARQANDEAAAARAREAAVDARIEEFSADVAAAEARLAILEALRQRQAGRLAEGEGPAVRLVAALQSLARRPAETTLVQPGSVGDLVHVRAALATVLPIVRQRTAAIRNDLAEARRLREAAALAAGSVRGTQTRLEAERRALARLEARHRDRAAALGRDMMLEEDRAIALGEEERDLIDQIGVETDAAEIRARLSALAAPDPRPAGVGAAETMAAGVAGAYRLPLQGRLVEGLGEVGANGVRSRGLTLAPEPGTVARAPAGGRIVFAGPFRQYGAIVVIDHGAGWTSLITGLGQLRVSAGGTVRQGAAIGRAAGERPRVMVELRRRNRPVDIPMLL